MTTKLAIYLQMLEGIIKMRTDANNLERGRKVWKHIFIFIYKLNDAILLSLKS